MVFVVDTTGSMSGLIEGAKQKIWGIVNQVMQESQVSSVRIGLVAYRDRGDDYLAQVIPLTDDLDKVYTVLMHYDARGGGDYAEDVRSALVASLNERIRRTTTTTTRRIRSLPRRLLFAEA
jgi:Mg-chelatase subunit ChlD